MDQDLLNAKVSYDAVMEKFRNGLADVGDEVQAKTKLLEQKLNIVTQKQTLNNAYTELVKQIGIPANEKIIMQDYPEQMITCAVDDLDALILEAMKNRPDLISAEANVLSKEKNLMANKRKIYPVIKGGFDIGRQYYQRGLNDDYNFAARITLDYPLFQGFFIKNEVKQARGELEVARASLEGLKLSILQEVTNYKIDMQLANEAVVFSEDFLKSASQDFQVNLKKYKVGTATIVELINAQTSVSDARSRVAEAKKNWYTSVANLAFATGALNQIKGTL
ncbi:MAG: TolC family protein [Simkaniaceae bacterium]|nr:TolC family protein [Simkaniaceae bacterium]